MSEAAVPQTILVVGGGGREHALAVALSRSPQVGRVVVAPGNAGTARQAKCMNHPTKDTDVPGLVRLAADIDAGLTVIGPEAAIAAGAVDALHAAGRRVFGPTASAARLETSKTWSREFMRRHAIAHPAFFTADRLSEADEAIDRFGGRCVVKADGLAAGKGVVVCDSTEEAREAARRMLVERAYGVAGERILIEERLEGSELSVMAVAAGTDYRLLIPAQDHKRLLDGDRGPNTGGMGAYSPAPRATPEILAKARRDIIEPTLAGLAADGCPFTGCLYAGLMLSSDGPKVIEFNCRFGDPETQVQMLLLQSDAYELLGAAADGRLAEAEARYGDDAACCVVLASPGYPEKSIAGKEVLGLDAAEAGRGVTVLHAGTRREAEDRPVIRTTGGRALCVVCVRPHLADAVRGAYAAIGAEGVHFDGMQYRRDIAKEALGIA